MDIPGFGRHSADIPEARHSGRREQEKRDREVERFAISVSGYWEGGGEQRPFKDTLSPADSNHSWHRNYQMSFNPN
jgi:hypothetical protein